MTVKDENAKEFTLEDFKLNPLSSLNAPPEEKITVGRESVYAPANDTDTVDGTGALNEPEDPIFKELSAPQLPELKKENRARLQMQSPTKIYFYWSFRQNPFQILSRIFGRNTNYQLIARLLNQRNGREELFPIEAEGSTWFDVDADASYQVEIGFYAVNRPFARVMFSNIIETPRKNPSPRQDYSEYFSVSSEQFAKVLDVSGFQQDAFEVALAGDDIEFADNATRSAFSQVTGESADDFDESFASEIRFVLLALASGYAVENLREHISPSLFAFLQKSAEKLSAERALTALEENFGEFADEESEGEETEEFVGAPVFGASSINFPRFSKRRRLTKFSTRFPSKFAPLSSLR